MENDVVSDNHEWAASDLVDHVSPTLIFKVGVGGMVNAKASHTQAPIPVASAQTKAEADEFAEVEWYAKENRGKQGRPRKKR